ncbi:MAG: AraC family transcriptional regulator [Bacteroidales bacterium]|nr:AraC family transcriptional regulator [Bacteroidales bacterium]
MKTPSFKYTTLSEQDQELNLYLTTVGVLDVKPGTNYPPKDGHPSRYWFNTDKGRILQEYQIIYITEGYGVFQNKYKIYRISPGTMIILFPGEWHRYRPLKSTGWKSHYIGFNGDMAKLLLKHIFFTPEKPIENIGLSTEILYYFDRIFYLTINEKPGYHQICVGLLIAYISQIIAAIKYKEFEGKEIEIKIRQACFLLNERVRHDVDVVKLAEDLNMGYSYFRKMFTKYTGLPPVQYHLQLRIRKAEIMLTTTNKTIKEIAYNLGFESAFYFSRVFKDKTNLSPVEYRKLHCIEPSGK